MNYTQNLSGPLSWSHVPKHQNPYSTPINYDACRHDTPRNEHCIDCCDERRVQDVECSRCAGAGEGNCED